MKSDFKYVPPARARAKGKAAPSLKETLSYLAILLRTDCDITGMRGNGTSDNGIQRQAHELGMDRRRFQRLMMHKDWETAREVAAKFHQSRTREKTFGNYVFKHLSAEARETWKKLQFWAEHKDGAEHIAMIMSKQGKRLRQEIFIHALVSTGYDISKALYMTGIPKTTLEHWRDDLEFAQLFDEIQWHKKNFFEKAMLDLVSERNPLATIWVNKTVNADRGYSEKIQVHHSGKIDQGGFTFEDLDLDIETRRKVLEAIRKRQALKNGNGMKQLPATVDVETVEQE